MEALPGIAPLKCPLFRSARAMGCDPQYVLGTFSIGGCPPFPAMVVGERAVALNAFRDAEAAPYGVSSLLELLARWPQNGPLLEAIAGTIRSGGGADLPFVPLDSLTVHPPFLPPAIYAAGANYRRHVIEIIIDRFGDATLSADEKRERAERTLDARAANGSPYIFMKSPASITGAFDEVVLPPDARQPDWEVELAVVIGRQARHIDRADVMEYIAGYAMANDVSDRAYTFRADQKEIGADWLASKSGPTYTPFGPYLVPASQVPDPHHLGIQLALNGELMQDADTSDMIFNIPALISYLSHRVVLRPGDIVLTGSPHGNGTHYNRYLKPGDVMEATVEGLGVQQTPCVAEV
jgi:2,4-diketo-3-deoxy-L-fuconate hydrolase